MPIMDGQYVEFDFNAPVDPADPTKGPGPKTVIFDTRFFSSVVEQMTIFAGGPFMLMAATVGTIETCAVNNPADLAAAGENCWCPEADTIATPGPAEPINTFSKASFVRVKFSGLTGQLGLGCGGRNPDDPPSRTPDTVVPIVTAP